MSTCSTLIGVLSDLASSGQACQMPNQGNHLLTQHLTGIPFTVAC